MHASLGCGGMTLFFMIHQAAIAQLGERQTEDLKVPPCSSFCCLCRMLFLQNASHLHSVVSLAVTLRLILAEGAIALSVTLSGGALFAS